MSEQDTNRQNEIENSSHLKSERFDLIIVGSGPIGLACALEAKKAGFSYVVIEKGTLVNSLYNYPLNMTFFSTSERLEIGAFLL